MSADLARCRNSYQAQKRLNKYSQDDHLTYIFLFKDMFFVFFYAHAQSPLRTSQPHSPVIHQIFNLAFLLLCISCQPVQKILLLPLTVLQILNEEATGEAESE